MEEEINQEKPETYKISVEIGESVKHEKYIKSIKVRSNDLDELRKNLKEAKEIAQSEWL